MKFKEELRKGNFIVGKCNICDKIIWPPSDFCSKCFGELEWKDLSNQGKLIEFSKKDNQTYAVVEFEDTIRIVGSLDTKSKQPEIGQSVKLEKCSIKDENYIFEMSL